MTLVVTGATGHLGRLVIDHLLARGTAAADILATGRDASKLADLEPLGVRTAVASFDDAGSLDAAFAGADAVLLVSGSEVGKRVAQHTAAVEAAQRAGARLVYTSAPAATDTTLILAPEHKATEEAIAAAGIPATILRNGWYTENYAGTITQLATTGSAASSAGDGRVSSAERTDFAEAAAVVLATDAYIGRVFELSGDVAWSFDELAATVADVSGSPARIEHVDGAEHVALLVGAGLDEGTAGFVAGLDANIAEGVLGVTTGELAELIGHPTAPLRSTVERILGVDAA
ncbi:NmrA family NAD(P)-binding protein [Microbacteriaceae bacterium VKM Ac-2855]|nr:NmrA family NAD(P)-binding protein [Microbacteriaceae bacterium VKM Ac-2855]